MATRTSTIPRPEKGVLIGLRLKPNKPEPPRLETFPPFLMFLAYTPDNQPGPSPEITPYEADEYLVCQRAALKSDPERVAHYTPYLFQYQVDERGRWTLWGLGTFQIRKIRSRQAAIAWMGLDTRLLPGVRRKVYDSLVSSLPWAVAVPLPPLLLRLADAVDCGVLPPLDWGI